MNIFLYPLVFIVLFLIYQIYKILLRPAFLILKYKLQFKDKIWVQYFPHLVSMNPMVRDFIKHKDCYYTFKKIVKENPELKAVIFSVTSEPSTIFFDPELGKQVVNNNQYYERVYNSVFAQEYLFKMGILTVSGTPWLPQRHLMAKGFNFMQVNKRIPLIQQISEKNFNPLYQQYKNDPKILDKPLSIRTLAMNVTAELAVKTFFIEGAPERYPYELSEVLTESYNIASSNWNYKIKSAFFGSIWAANHLLGKQEKLLIKRMEQLHDIARQLIRTRKVANQPAQDILDIYLEENEILKENGKPIIPEQEIIDQFLMLVSVGMEPPAASFGMSFYLLAIYPEYQKRVRNEINEVIGDSNDYTPEKLDKLVLLHCFLLESMRLYPSDAALIQKRALVDHKIGDFFIRKGQFLNVSTLGIMYNDMYYDDPYTFKPERWQKSWKQVDPYKYMVFSAGPRNCVGQRLSMITAKVMMIHLLQKFEIFENKDVEFSMREEFSYSPYDDRLIILSPIK